MPTPPVRRPTRRFVSRLAASLACACAVALAARSDAAPGACGSPFTPIPAIQGRGPATPLAGEPVTTEGVVVADFEGPAPALRGFYLQDPVGDGDPATSDALFVFHHVFHHDRDEVRLGRRVRVAGRADEFHGQTQIRARAVRDCGRGAPVEPVDVTLPLASAGALEPFEGMLVRLPQTLVVTDTYRLGRFGEVGLASRGRLPIPTQVAAPGAPARAVQAANALDRILLDDASQGQHPDPVPFARGGGALGAGGTLRGGDTVTGVVGVLTWTWGGAPASPGAWRVRPLGALGGTRPVFEASGPRPPAPPRIPGAVRVIGANLHNYFDSFGASCTRGVGGPAVACRGARDARELERQAGKLVAMLTALDPDVAGVVELENDGYTEASAIADLVRRLAAASGARWAFVDADAGTGRRNALGDDAIKVGLLYRPDAVAPVGAPAVLARGAFGRFRTIRGRVQRNRPALAQTFEVLESGERFTVVVIHLKSRGSSCADNVSPAPADRDRGDGQGECSATRLAAARALAAWLAADPTGAADPDVLIVGDANAYPREEPIAALVEAGFVDLLARSPGRTYTYAFDGQWGRLDHALASPSLARRVRSATTWAVNADEPALLGERGDARHSHAREPDPYRASDHDPVVVDMAGR